MKAFFILIMSAVAVMVFIYGIPAEIKDKALALLGRAKIIPISIKEKVEDFTATPAEKREKLLNQLGDRLIELKSSSGVSQAAGIIEKIEKTIEELKSKNEDKPTIINQIVNRVVEQVIPDVSGQNGSAPKESAPESKSSQGAAPLPAEKCRD